VHEDIVLLWAFFQILKTLDVLGRVVKTRGKNECLVGEFLIVAELQMVLIRINLSDKLVSLDFRPSVDLG